MIVKAKARLDTALLTIVVHRPLEPAVPLSEHFGVNVDDIYTCFPIIVFVFGVVEDPEGDITRSASQVDALHRSLRSGLQRADELIFPETVYAHGHGVVHDIIR